MRECFQAVSAGFRTSASLRARLGNPFIRCGTEHSLHMCSPSFQSELKLQVRFLIDNVSQHMVANCNPPAHRDANTELALCRPCVEKLQRTRVAHLFRGVEVESGVDSTPPRPKPWATQPVDGSQKSWWNPHYPRCAAVSGNPVLEGSVPLPAGGVRRVRAAGASLRTPCVSMSPGLRPVL